MEVLGGPYGNGEDAIDETADVPATGGLYDSLLITSQWRCSHIRESV